MRDFTLKIYIELLQALVCKHHQFLTFKDWFDKDAEHVNPVSILRHDVDARPGNSLEFARIQADLGIRGTYYFRAVPGSWDEKIILEIAALGHEVGYHYENMDTCKGNPDRAIADFERHLQALRSLVPVRTICMHGSPRSRYDNKDLWKYYDYREFGILGEPYFDVDFSQMAYLTDTGRSWNGGQYSVRDRVDSPFDLRVSSTSDLIQKVPEFPQRLMITFHPQRWTDHRGRWMQEWVLQNIKNQVKRVILKVR